MSAIRGAGVLLMLSCVRLLLFAPSPCAGEGSDCSCNATNSRCDEFGVCRCDPGWDGALCQRCVTMPGCVHGSCLQPWQCACQPGWGGRFCDKDLSVCSQQPCLNGATCLLEDSGDFRCLCPDGFHGPTCRKRKGPCLQTRSPCKNGGLCDDADGFAAALLCRCLAGFTGPRCETDIDDCLLGPCASGATCVDGVNRFSCLCPVGFSGRFCTVNVDDCASRPCRNGGRCLDRAGGFRCLCRPGFTGTTCETPPSPANAGPSPANAGPSPANAGPSPPVWTTRARDTGHHDNRKVKVTVKERGAGGLSDLQLVVVLVLTSVSVGAVALTAALVLHAPCQRRGHAPCQRRGHAPCQRRGHAPCWSSPSRRSSQEPAEQPEQRISVLNATEPPKKKLNIEAV
ncbi:protein delta homolog 2 [Poeciliopsis prolifica]|uniref:protein delta homolog 2 n=1 Tax=Poeciliopsis prolifica TaxID=188132 RepID=UPI0024144D3A|nr:protein delta homolog 2 [Poeciliopsis prolifica]XP_054881677.1 protein delta homolog 2 [Poeciliopsis prolifica]